MSTEMRRVLLTKHKQTTTAPPTSQLKTPTALMRASGIDLSPQSSAAAVHKDTSPNLPTAVRDPSVKRENCSPATNKQVKSEPRSPPPPQPIPSTAPEQTLSMPAASDSTPTAAMPVSSLISAMIDSTAYPSAGPKSPSVPCSTGTSDEQVAKKFAAGIASLPVDAPGSQQKQSVQQPDDFTGLDPASLATPKPVSRKRYAWLEKKEPASTANVRALSSDTPPTASISSLQNSRAISSSPGSPQPEKRQRLPQTAPKPNAEKAKLSTPSSLYPGPSTTMPPPNLQDANAAKKRSRLARADHPERFQYAGNTFSNLDDSTFHQTVQQNPYLSELTIDASRPVYNSPKEARHALKEAAKPPVAPVNYDKQIKELETTIANFRKKYEKTKMMTAQAGIQVAGNVWDRLSNIVQYPPVFDEYAQNGPDDLANYSKEMRAWDKAIGHQVIIKKRIVYKEAIEKLHVKLQILQTEKDLDGHNTRLKRKAAQALDDED
ncbi:hypothetical protein GJ744_005574 [Endocarpon pusillum]|uniref:Uncharacterized protein n=1 Tax=Endocarpon pusillum TaxID=364733 RepID=A0A8H7AKW7_9EURO|nr:hypothetical protein GJ744_005574 [Endocarpon pusillum]